VERIASGLALGVGTGEHTMEIYVLAEDDHSLKGWYDPDTIRGVLGKVAATTDVAALVVAVYLLSRTTVWRGQFMGEEVGPEGFRAYSGRKWSFVRRHALPEDLPKRFRLIRMAFGTSARYPKTTVDQYGWKERFERFQDHLANLFAHELHHYRRHHLGLHPGEGEQSACQWGLTRAKAAGFSVTAVRVRRHRRRPKKRIRMPENGRPSLVRRAKLMLSHLSPQDLEEVAAWITSRMTCLESQAKQEKEQEHFERLRALPNDATVRILRDSVRPSAYVDQVAVKIGTLRRNSRRLAIQTADGHPWHWPMAWLEPVDQIVESALGTQEDGSERAV
jgi:hypothetical protein